MRILEIQGPTSAHSRQITTLSGEQYTLKFDWNGRLLRWVFAIFDVNENPLVQGVAMLHGMDLLEHHHSVEGVPDSPLMVIDTTGQKRDPVWSSFSKEHVLVYFET